MIKKKSKFRPVQILAEDHAKLVKWADQRGMKIYAIINSLINK